MGRKALCVTQYTDLILSTFFLLLTGSLCDLESLDLEAKLGVLRQHRLWKCMNKTEVLEEHDETWTTNGISSLASVTVLDQAPLDTHATIYTVQVGPNDHWTDLVSGLEDTQLDRPVQELKAEYNRRLTAKI